MLNAPPRFPPAWMLAILLLTAVCGKTAHAGGGPENVFVVVNPRSWASLSVANHFCQLRRIPPGNVFYLDWSQSVDQTDVDLFRRVILGPVLLEIKRRRLLRQIDYVVYSSDYPYAVVIQRDLEDKQKFPVGSLTGLTYLAPLVIGSHQQYTRLDSNWYMAVSPTDSGASITRGFRTTYGWKPDGNRDDDAGQHYMLSAMLAYTSGRGNSVGEAVRYLRRSALADGTHPNGTVYFVHNADIRSAKRHDRFPAAVRQLKQLGVKAEVLKGIVPHGKHDVQGAVTGKADLKWQQSGNTILPGAICENFTSFGGVLSERTSQTKLSVFLRYGAAGSSGTVVEPYAIPQKFPDPMIQVHYGRGCTLAEAFYQSVRGPYQLLIVGDPLCRPWAVIPTVAVEGLQPGQTVRDQITFTPVAVAPIGRQIRHVEIFVDGQRSQTKQPGEPVHLNTKELPDGYHELRLVAVEDSPIESQGRMLVPFVVNNRGRKIECQLEPAGPFLPMGRSFRFTAESPESTKIAVFHNRRPIGLIPGEKGQLVINTATLGLGPTTLQAIGLGKDVQADRVFSAPLQVIVQPGTPLQSIPIPDSDRLVQGLGLRTASGDSVTVSGTHAANWLSKAGVKENESFQLSGLFRVPETDIYQFQVAYQGSISVTVNGTPVFRDSQDSFAHRYIPVVLESGWHQMELDGQLQGPVRLLVSFGGAGTLSLNENLFKSLP